MLMLRYLFRNQLGIHKRGVVLYNVGGYYDGLIQWVKSAVTAEFISPGNAGIIVEALDAEECISVLRDYKISEQRLSLDVSASQHSCTLI